MKLNRKLKIKIFFKILPTKDKSKPSFLFHLIYDLPSMAIQPLMAVDYVSYVC